MQISRWGVLFIIFLAIVASIARYRKESYFVMSSLKQPPTFDPSRGDCYVDWKSDVEI